MTFLQSDEITPVAGLTALLPIRFHMLTEVGGTVLVDADATWVDAPNAKAKYSWMPGETDVVGSHIAEWEITVSGKKMTIPTKKYTPVNITAKLA